MNEPDISKVPLEGSCRFAVETGRGWERSELLPAERLDEFAWHKGFFTLNWGDSEVWRRNFNEIRLRDISLFTLGNLQGKSALDVGCGAGLYLLTFLRLGAASVAGQDLSDSSIAAAKKYCDNSGFKNYDLKVGDCTKLRFADESFDCVFSGDFFEHITDEQKYLVMSEIFRVLKPGGVVTIKTPNLTYLKAVVYMKRAMALLRLRSPWNIHVAHTKNNPNNEHHGLTNYERLEACFLDNMFHTPKITNLELMRRGIPKWLRRMLRPVPLLNETIIMTAKKPVFYSLYK